MESSYRIKSVSLLTILSFASVLSANAATNYVEEVTSCTDDLSASSTTYQLKNDIYCNTGEGLVLSGSYSQLLLNGYSIIHNGPPEPIIGINITNDHNEIHGPGKVESFGYNIKIERANDNLITGITSSVSHYGIFVLGDALGSANRNHIINNEIEDSELSGIRLVNYDDDTVNYNEIAYNKISSLKDGIQIISGGSSTASASNNDLSYNEIESPQGFGILVGATNGSVNYNKISYNTIKDANIGIFLDTYQDGIAERNLITRNKLNSVKLAIGLASVNLYNSIVGNAISFNLVNQDTLPAFSDCNVGATNRNNIWEFNVVNSRSTSDRSRCTLIL